MEWSRARLLGTPFTFKAFPYYYFKIPRIWTMWVAQIPRIFMKTRTINQDTSKYWNQRQNKIKIEQAIETARPHVKRRHFKTRSLKKHCDNNNLQTVTEKVKIIDILAITRTV